jgi:membrane fusion protein, multidrug efflux system
MSFKNTIHFVLIISTLGLSGLLINGCSKGNGSQPVRGGGGKNIVPVEALVVKPQLLRNTIFTTGTLLANEEVELRSEISGRVTGVFFEEGKRVRKGEPLLKINDRELKAQLKRKEVEEKQAADEESRQKRLYDIKVISQEEYDKTLNALKMVQAEKEAIESQIAETEITAPFNGIVGLRYVSQGGYVTPNVMVATMQDTDPMKVEFSVPEKYAGQIKNGTVITARIGDSQEEHKGVVYAVESKIDADTRTIKSRAKIANPDGSLITGSFAKVAITLEELPDAIVIPSEAIVPEIKGEKVYLCDNGKAKSVMVTTGIRTERDVQITRGLNADDTLIVSGLLQLSDGAGVQIKSLRDN